MRSNTIKDFWKKVDKSQECWEWLGAKDQDGYGLFHYSGKTIRTARFVMRYVMNKTIDKLEVCHHCDNPSCVRPSHLFLGTAADNAKDRDTKGRGTKGRKRPEEMIARQVATRLQNGKRWTQEMKERASLAKLGKKMSDKARENMSLARLGITRPDLSKILSGEGNGRAVMTEQSVRLLRNLYKSGKTKASLSRMFNIGETQVSRIVSGEAWKNILDEGGNTDLDEYITTGSKVGLVRADKLFKELT